jgi:hypothetical protein
VEILSFLCAPGTARSHCQASVFMELGMEAASATVVGGSGAGLTRWQAAALAGWVWATSFYDLTRRARALVQPWVTRRVHAETPTILRFQVRPIRVDSSSLVCRLLLYGYVISTRFYFFSDEQNNCITIRYDASPYKLLNLYLL